MVKSMRIPLIFSLALLACGRLWSQIEPGLESAVNWKWWVVPAETEEWGLPLPDELRPKPLADSSTKPLKATVVRPDSYEVKKGDAIIKIAKKFEITPAQLKQFNALLDDRIRIGQILRIPSPGEVLTMVPPPPPDPSKQVATRDGLVKSEPEPVVDTGGQAQLELDNVRLQVFLDREIFSPGPIDGKSGPVFLKACEIYQKTHEDALSPGMLKSKAEAIVKEPYTRYVLRPDDFKFIKSSKSQALVPVIGSTSSTRKKTPKTDKASLTPPPISIDGLIAEVFMSYTTVWEFVAERFHCDEAFLRHINQAVKEVPTVGTEFQVPNVIPFEIERALDLPLQPAADPAKPVVAAVVLISRLEISQGGKLIAVMPLTSARPALRGRGSWTILDAISQPRLATKREPRETPKETPAPVDPAVSQPVIEAPLEKEQFLASGPNNPVGVLWINLAKSGSTEPLPYGLHGTSIPAKMKLQGIGGLRLTNWDIARVIRLIPAGTPLQWKAQ
jgi:LysM repeat protein